MRPLHLIVLCAFALPACKTQDEALVGKPPAATDDVVSGPKTLSSMEPERASRPTFPPPELSVATWPHADDRTTFRLTWRGGDRPVPLHEEPDPNSALLGDVVWNDNEEIQWLNSVVAVYQPAKLRAKAEWFAEGPVHTIGYQTEVDFVSETIAKGEVVDVYLYAGAGQCYLGVKGKIFTGTCPPQDKFHGQFAGEMESAWYQPVKKVWWIQIGNGPTTGWFPMDDRVAVDIEKS